MYKFIFIQNICFVIIWYNTMLYVYSQTLFSKYMIFSIYNPKTERCKRKVVNIKIVFV